MNDGVKLLMPIQRRHVAGSVASAVMILLILRVSSRDPAESTLKVDSAPKLRPMAVALSISGQARGSMSRFATQLHMHVINPAAQQALFDALIWLQDAAAERQLQGLLCSGRAMHRCLTRQEALMTRPPLPAAMFDESASISAMHDPATYGSAWVQGMSENTLRMFHKLRGVEYLRIQVLAAGSADHDWVLRIRPDLELTQAIELPPAPPHASKTLIYVPWLCEGERLLTDQLLLLPGQTEAPTRLASLYEPSHLREAISASDPPTMYPERLVWHALLASGRPSADALHPVYGVALMANGVGLDLRLMGTTESEPFRDAYAKLKRDYPGCFRD